MCEVEDGVMCPGEEKGGRSGRLCIKCKETPAVLVIRVGDAFCKSCFNDYFVHKFRAVLGKTRVVYPGEKVLLSYSGGPSSSAMIRQVREGLGRDAPKKLRFIPGILFIDEGAVCGQSWEQREQNVSEIQRVLQTTNFPSHIVALEQVFSLPRSVLQSELPGNPQHAENYKAAVNNFVGQQRGELPGISDELPGISDELPGIADELAQLRVMGYECSSTYSCPPAELTAALMEIFNSARTMTAKLELLQSLRSHLILHVARTCGYSKVMSGESCTRLAIRLLANISLGRGAFLPLDTGFSDDRYGNVVIVRPMRDYSLKEISFYNRLFNVQSVFIPTLETKAPENSSIQHLTESFIINLQADFPSTVSTAYRTGEKLNISRTEIAEKNLQEERCLICMCSLDTRVATQVSQHLSQKRPKKNPEATRAQDKQSCDARESGERSTCCSSSVPSTLDFLPLLCYGCRVTVRDVTSVSRFPPYILLEAELRRRRLEMRREIEDFLLDDGGGDMCDLPPSIVTGGIADSHDSNNFYC